MRKVIIKNTNTLNIINNVVSHFNMCLSEEDQLPFLELNKIYTIEREFRSLMLSTIHSNPSYYYELSEYTAYKEYIHRYEEHLSKQVKRINFKADLFQTIL